MAASSKIEEEEIDSKWGDKLRYGGQRYLPDVSEWINGFCYYYVKQKKISGQNEMSCRNQYPRNN